MIYKVSERKKRSQFSFVVKCRHLWIMITFTNKVVLNWNAHLVQLCFSVTFWTDHVLLQLSFPISKQAAYAISSFCAMAYKRVKENACDNAGNVMWQCCGNRNPTHILSEFFCVLPHVMHGIIELVDHFLINWRHRWGSIALHRRSGTLV